MWRYHRTFKRGYDKNFTDEYFTIHKVLKNLPVLRYQLKDFKNDKIVGNYFQEELVLFTPKDFYKINIIGEKGSGKNKKLLINWDGWPDSYNQWIAASEVENFYQNEGENSIIENNVENNTQEENSQEYYASTEDVNNINDVNKQMNIIQDKNKNLSVDFADDRNVVLIEEKNKNQTKKRKLSDVFNPSKRSKSQKIVKVNIVDNMETPKIIDISKKKRK